MDSPHTAVRVVTIHTIGFAGKSAREFFTTLSEARVRKVLDTRLNNVSQLAGFTKREDLRYFLRQIAGIDYEHDLRLAPTKEILKAYRKKEIDWCEYERRFLALIESRRIEAVYTPEQLDGVCLLCSEKTPEHCHRRLVVEYLQRRWEGVRINHL